MEAHIDPLTVSIIETQRLTGLSRTTIWALAKAGEIDICHIGRRSLVVYRSLVDLISKATCEPLMLAGAERDPAFSKSKINDPPSAGKENHG